MLDEGLITTAVGDRPLVAAQLAMQRRLLEQLDRVAGRSSAKSDDVQSPDSPLYRFVSRVLEIHGEPGRFEPPASITAEYDIPEHAWYTLDGVVPAGVVIETTQCVLALLEHLGVKVGTGQVYRLLSADPVFHDRLPREGQKIVFRAEATGFEARGDGLLVHFTFECHVDGVLVMEMTDACAGYGMPAELLSGRAELADTRGQHRRDRRAPTKFKPLERTDRVNLTAEDIDLLTRGELAAVFGRYWDQRADGCNRSIRLATGGIRMIDEVTTIDRFGGSRGFGELIATRAVDANGWYFHGALGSAMPATLLVAGATQLLQVYLMYSGLHLVFPDGEFQPAFDIPARVEILEQVTAQTRAITYRADITDSALLPRPNVVADLTVYADGRPVLRITDLAVQAREKPGTPIGPGADGVMPFLGRRNHAGEATHSNEFHLALAGDGKFAAAMGSELSAATGVGNRVPRTPGGDYQRFDRIQQFRGTPGVFDDDALLVTEYDSDPEWWYYHDNGSTTMPNFIYQEIALQSSLLLGYLLGGPLLFPEDDLFVRNLDGYATLTRPVDLRGKTIRHETVLKTHLPGSGVLLQRFGFRLFTDGELFYEGQTMYGYFPGEWLKHQRGMDGGKYRPSWLEENPNPPGAHSLSIRSDDRWRQPQPGTGLRLADGRLRLVDEVTVAPDGGVFGKGYVHGVRAVDPSDWYFDVHNDLDKVMPGTLGIESLVQALQIFVLDAGLAADMGPVRFEAPVGVQVRWTYRGQVEIHDKQMSFDLSVKEIRREPGRLLVVADANVWKPGLRIYEVSDVAVEVRPSGQGLEEAACVTTQGPRSGDVQHSPSGQGLEEAACVTTQGPRSGEGQHSASGEVVSS